MAFTGSFVCHNWKADILRLALAGTIKWALFTGSASLDANTTTYSATNEVPNGSGYITGGVAASGLATSLSSNVGIADWNDPTWTSASFTARGMQQYHSSDSNKSMAIIDFGADKTVINGTFVAVLPAADSTHAMWRVS